METDLYRAFILVVITAAAAYGGSSSVFVESAEINSSREGVDLDIRSAESEYSTLAVSNLLVHNAETAMNKSLYEISFIEQFQSIATTSYGFLQQTQYHLIHPRAPPTHV